jgi:hypothetical protein
MNTNDRNQTLKWALLAGVLVILGAADMAWPYWLAWLANVAVLQGSSLGICLYKRNVLAWAAFGVLAAVSLANAVLYWVCHESRSAVTLGDLVIGVALFGAWHYLFSAKTIRPQAAPPAQVVHHIHHGLPGGNPAAGIESEAFPVIPGTVVRPSLGRRSRDAIGSGGSTPSRHRRALEAVGRIAGGNSR